MLEIVLLILKIAGIIFVSVLGILLVMACLALFVPVRYRGDFSVSDAEEDGKKAVNAKLRAAWLLHLVRMSVSYEKTARVRVKVLFFTLMDTGKEKRQKKEKKEKRGKPEETERPFIDAESGQKTGSDQGTLTGETDGKEASTEKTADGERNETSDGEAVKKTPDREQEEPEDSENRRGKEEADREKEGISARISKILQTIRDFCDKLKGIKEKVERAEELWISDHMVNSRSLLGRQLAYLLKHTKPKKLAGYIRFGFEDPSTTGYAMALYGILYPVWSPKLSVEPDFERQMLDCHILLKGKMKVWHFVRAALRLLLSKDVRRAVKDIKKL